MKKNYFTSLLLLLLFISVFSSCKRDKVNRDQAIIEVDFLLNERDLEKFGLDYTEQELDRDSNDPNKVLTVKVGEPVTFKDISKGSSSSSRIRWELNGNEWEQAEKDKNVHVPEFTHTFDTPGYHRVSLFVEDVSYATKMIKVVPSDTEIAENIEEVVQDDQQAESSAINVDKPQREKDDLFQAKQSVQTKKEAKIETKEKATPKSPVKRKVTPAAPKPIKVSNVDFSISGNYMVGSTIQLKDISSPAGAVTMRQWDMGDGTTQKTKGSVYNQIYFSSGKKTITLCVNNTNQCSSRTIDIKPRPARKETAAKKMEPKPTPPPAKKPEIKKIEFIIPSTAVAGTSVSLSDRSQPSSIISKRRWSFGDGTPDLNTGRSSISHVFLKPGKYDVKLCLNDDNTKCTTRSISISEKPKPKPAPVVTSKTTKKVSNDPDWLKNYDGTQAGRVGLLSSQKCDETESEWYSGSASVSITPIKPMELDVIKVYASGNGTVDVILSSNNGVEGTLKNVQVNPGPSEIYLVDLAVIMEPNIKYSLNIKPSSSDGKLRLENSAKCKPRPLTSDIVKVDYGGKFVIYDLKFFY